MQHNLAFFQLLFGETELYALADKTLKVVHVPAETPAKIEPTQLAEPPMATIQVQKTEMYPAEFVCLVTDILSEENLEQVNRMLAALKFDPKMVVHRQMLTFEKATLMALAKTSKAKHLLVFTNETPDDKQLAEKFTPFFWDEVEVARFDSFDSIRTSAEIKLAVWAAIKKLQF